IVNGRYIKSPAITHAVLRAYDTLLPIRRFPVVVISLQLDPILLDVNVHPTKLEVRFSKETELVALIEKAIREKFQQHTLIPSLSFDPAERKEKERSEQRSLALERHDRSRAQHST